MRSLNEGNDGFMRKNITKAFAGVGFLKLVSMGLGFLTSMIVARGLGAENYGVYVLVTSVMAVLALPLYAGMPALLVREIVRIRIEKDWPLFSGAKHRVSQAILVGSLIVFSMVVGFYLFGLYSGDSNTATFLLLAFPLAPLMALNGTRAAMLRGFDKVFYSQLPDQIIKPLTHLSILCFLAFSGLMTAAWALGSLMTATLVAFVFGAFVLRKQLNLLPDVTERKYETVRWVKSLMPFTAIAAIYTVNNQAAILILGLVSENSEVAYLRVADRMAQVVVIALTVANVVSGPQIARFAKLHDYSQLEKTARHAVRLALLIASPVVIIYFFFGETIVRLAFGDEYSLKVWLPLIIISAGQLVNVFFGSVGNVLNMTGNERLSLIGVLLGLSTNVILSVVLIPQYHAVGAAIACSSGIMVWNIALAIFVKLKINIRTMPF